ncbi:hypothetical protein HZC35_05460 [Candidatus Saganbacteria bacterium]|nr:hypothetical protein [Candidatus Saganbacteria bacterium]
MADEVAEKPVEPTESLRPVSGRRADELIEAVGNMSIEDLQKSDAGLKLIIAQYKEKCEECRASQDKINILSLKNSDLISKLGVARERIKNTSGIGIVIQSINIIAGAMIAFLTTLPDGLIRTILFILAIGLFVVCAIYNYLVRDNQKDIEESGNKK